MAMDLLEMATKGLGPDFASKIAGLVGENVQGTQSVLDSGLPLLFSGLANKSGAPNGASEVLNLLNSLGAADSQLSNIAGLLSGGGIGGLGAAGNSIISALFGNKSDGIYSALAGLAGVKPGSATTLLSAVAPLAFGMLRRHTAKEGLGASGLASLLLGQRDSLARKVPESLSRAAGFAPASHITALSANEAKSSGFLRWLPWIIGALLALWLLSRCTAQQEVAPVQSVPAPVAEPAPAPVLPATATVYFDTGSSTPGMDAGSTLAAVADHAKANPTARLAVSGFHDPSGDAAANEAVSLGRATAVRDLLISMGVSADQIDLEKPVVTTGGGEERASRRVEVSVR
jgi:OmpA-OmpF porin, OOP family